jgi:HEAT repeat protein
LDPDLAPVYVPALGKLGDPRAVEAIIPLLGHYRGDLRYAAATALAKLGEPKWRVLNKGGDDDFFNLGAYGGPRAVEPLIFALEAGNCREAARALAIVNDRRAVESLIRALDNKYYEGRSAAAETLGKLEDPRAVEPLIRTLRDPYLTVREAAAAALVRLASVCPTAIGRRWSEVRQLITEPISFGPDHESKGIGLDFPEPPTDLDA